MATKVSPQKRTAILKRLDSIDKRRDKITTEDESLIDEAQSLVKGTDIRWFPGSRGRASNGALLATLVLHTSGDPKKPSDLPSLEKAVTEARATDASKPRVVIVQKMNAEETMKLEGREVVPANLFKKVARGRYVLTGEGQKHRKRIRDAARRR